MMDSEERNENVTRAPRENWFAKISLLCGMSIFCLPLLYSPLIAIMPIVSVIGLLSGIVGLIQAYRDPQPNPGVRQAWIGTVLCLVVFTVCGLFVPRLYNYAQSSQRLSIPRQFSINLTQYAQTHVHYPASIRELGIPPEKLTYKIFHFYFLHSKRPYLFNGHLAGKRVDSIMHPERTVMIAPGIQNGATLFYSQADIDWDRPFFAFVDGHTERVADSEMAKRFPPNGTVTEETWFIKPQLKE